MARLKVKQISDFTTAVQTLIDNDADQNATIIGNISDTLSNEASDTNSDVVSIDAVLGTIATGSALGDVSDALTNEISDTNSDVVSLDSYIDGVSSDLADEISDTNSDVVSLDAAIGVNASGLGDVSNAVSTILAGSTTDLDAFAEVISYVDSLDTADGGALTSQIASIDTRVSLNTSSDVALSGALADEISDTNSDVASIDAVLGTIATGSALGDVSDALTNEISDTNSDVVSLDSYIDGVSSDLADEISDTTSDVSSIDGAIGSVATLLDGFAKEAYIQGAFSDIVTGGGMTAQVVDTTGVQLDGGVTATEGAGTVAVDLVQPIEGNSDLEMEANLVFVTINGQYVNHDAIRINSATGFSVIGGQLGFDLEADDVLEFKYIKD